MNAHYFICICETATGWIEEGKDTSPCPICNRVYKGVVNSKTRKLEPIEQRED